MQARAFDADARSALVRPSTATGDSTGFQMPTAPSTGGWLVDVGAYYLFPMWGNNPAYMSRVTDQYGNIVQTQTDFDMPGQFAPLLSIGYVTPSGFGLQARWWQLHDTTNILGVSPSSTAANPPYTTIYTAYPAGLGFAATTTVPGSDSMSFGSDLDMSVADLEAIWDLHPGRWSLLMGAGLRYAHISQNYSATWISTSPPTPALTNQVLSGHNFSGLGPMLSLATRYPFGDSGLAILASTREGLLFGSGRQQVTYQQFDSQNLYQSLENNMQSQGVMPFAELEIGAEWGRKFGIYEFSAQAALVGQFWGNAGNATNTQAWSNQGSSGIDSQESLGLLGIRLTASLSY